MNAIENWLLNVFVGKLIARAAVTVTAFVAGNAAQALLAKFGVQVQIDPAKLAAGSIAAGQAGYEWFKARRMANPNSPAVQTDPAKPGAGALPSAPQP